MTTILGVLLVTAGGLAMGSGAWPFKLMRKYQFEHWWFVAMLVGLIIMPWTITLIGCPHALQSLRNIPASALILGNLFAVGWGVANVLNGVCLVRIGVALTGAIAHAVLFLASPEASYVNGSVLTVDGGWTAGYLREF